MICQLTRSLWMLCFCGLPVLANNGCGTVKSKAVNTNHEASRLVPVQQFSLPTAQAFIKNVASEPESNTELKVVAAPDISARNHPQIDLSEKDYNPKKEPIKVQLLNYWDDSKTYYANLNYKNTGPQITKNIYIFGYDRLGRLVSTTVRNTFFRKQQNLVRTERFAKSGQAVRWSILVKN